jgi:hypothetical protein
MHLTLASFSGLVGDSQPFDFFDHAHRYQQHVVHLLIVGAALDQYQVP